MPRKPAPCGTKTAYNRHKRNDEDPCEDCLRAKREDEQARREAKRAEQVEQVHEVLEGIVEDPDSDRLVLLREQRDLLRAHSLKAPPNAIAGISKQLSATLAEIEGLENPEAQSSTAAPASASGSSAPRGGVDDLKRRREQREADRRSAS